MFCTLKDFEEAFARNLTLEEVERLAVAFESRKEFLPAYQQAQFTKRLTQLRKDNQNETAIPTFQVAVKKALNADVKLPTPVQANAEVSENGSYVFDGQDVDLPNILVSNLTIRNLHGRTVRCAPCLNSLYIEDCSDLELHGIAHQVRCSRVTKAKLYLFSRTPVAVEDCTFVEISPVSQDLPAKFMGIPNRASEVIDFSN